MTRLPLFAAASAALMLSGVAAQAQDYPVDTVTLITHSSPGGGSDVFLRELSRNVIV
jgi:putative tricarboxylic transport membrane protein